jgi:hypothetical protein
MQSRFVFVTTKLSSQHNILHTVYVTRYMYMYIETGLDQIALYRAFKQSETEELGLVSTSTMSPMAVQYRITLAETRLHAKPMQYGISGPKPDYRQNPCSIGSLG